jgi:oxygen-independent coproporphyrinogen-3 oxidase
MIEALMCDFRIDAEEFRRDHGLGEDRLGALFAPVVRQFGDFVRVDRAGLAITPAGRPLTRMIARMFDAYDMAASGHSPAI